MSHASKILVSRHHETEGTPQSYVIGFMVSVAITLTAYLCVTHRVFATNAVLIGTVIALALAQFIIQLVFFLHLGKEAKPRWKLAVFILMICVVGILVGGSLWIMNNLNSHMKMTTQQMENYMNNQDGL